MLAPNFRPAVDLGVTDVERDALIALLGKMERGEIKAHQFDMGQYCGTVHCMCGWAHVIDRRAFPELNVFDHKGQFENPTGALSHRLPTDALRLFNLDWIGFPRFMANDATVEQAALALRNFLTVKGDPWRGVLYP